MLKADILSWQHPSLINSKYANHSVASKAFRDVWMGWVGGLWHPNGLFPAHLATAVCCLPNSYVIWWGRGWHRFRCEGWSFFGTVLCAIVYVRLCVGRGIRGAHGVTVWSTNRALTSVIQLEYSKSRQASLQQGVEAAFLLFCHLHLLFSLLFSVPSYWTGWQNNIRKQRQAYTPTHRHTYTHINLLILVTIKSSLI